MSFDEFEKANSFYPDKNNLQIYNMKNVLVSIMKTSFLFS
jgi:hypothetical protein